MADLSMIHPDALELAQLLRPTWDETLQRLHASGVPLNAEDGAGGDGGTDGTDGADNPGDEPGRDGQGDDKLGDAGTKALREERAARRDAEKQLKDLQAKVQQFEDRDKTDQQKLEDRATAAETGKAQVESDLAAANAKLLRYEVAAEKGLSLKHAARLQGDTREALEQDADELAKDLPGHGRGAGDFDGGDRGGSGHEPAPGLSRLAAAYAHPPK